jgi:hypothetical protein
MRAGLFLVLGWQQTLEISTDLLYNLSRAGRHCPDALLDLFHLARSPTMRSTHEAKKQQLIADLTGARREVLAAAMALRREQQNLPFLGTWSAHDIVAHLVGWDYANLAAFEAIRDGRLPGFYNHYDHDWRTFNAGLVAQHKQKALEETVVLAEASYQALQTALAALPAEDVSRDYGVRSSSRRRVTIAMLLGVGDRDERKHAGQIREFAARGKGSEPGTIP